MLAAGGVRVHLWSSCESSQVHGAGDRGPAHPDGGHLQGQDGGESYFYMIDGHHSCFSSNISTVYLKGFGYFSCAGRGLCFSRYCLCSDEPRDPLLCVIVSSYGEDV